MNQSASRGTDRIRAAFARATEEGRTALIVFLAAGDPDYETTLALARAAVAAGADLIELGSPFTDPLADGPVVQAAYTRALANGATTAATLDCARRVAAETGIPVVLMVGVNTVLARGFHRFCRDAADAGASGLLVPDLPVDDAEELSAAARATGLGTMFLVGPHSGPDRVAAAAGASTGFVYVLRRPGITGAGPGSLDLATRVRQARAAGPAPVAAGFGITGPGDVAELADVADGVIIGSALVQAAHEAGDPAEAARAVSERVAALRAATHRTGVEPAAALSPAPGTGGAE
jgi:tryptophan synthase alpha chain